MVAGRYTLRINQGFDWSKNLVYKDSAGDPKDLTGYEASLVVRAYHGADATMMELTPDDIVMGVDGTITITATALQTDGLTDDGVYQLVLTDPDGKLIPLLEGRVNVETKVID